MADAEVAKKRGRPFKRDSADGQAGELATRAGADAGAEGQGLGSGLGAGSVLTWLEYENKLFTWEFENPVDRITRVYFDGECPPEYVGCYSQAPVSHGKPAFMLSTGEITRI